MTAFTPDTIRNIARYAGTMPPQKIAERLGFALSFVERVARDQHLDLRLESERPAPRMPAPDVHVARIAPEERRIGNLTANFRPAHLKKLREIAAARRVKPGRLLADVFEGALVRGQVDELADMADPVRSYRPNPAKIENDNP